MKVYILISFNPYYLNTASANRWLTLIDGLSELGVKIVLLIHGGYTSMDEFRSRDIFNRGNNVKLRYLLPWINYNIWFRRIFLYVLLPLIQTLLVKQILKIIRTEKPDFIWPSCDFVGFQVISLSKKKNTGTSTFIELSEFLDIHNSNKGSFFGKKREDRIHNLFKSRTIQDFDGIALMTKELYRYFEAISNPKTKLFHLPMTVDLERFKEPGSPPPHFKLPYIVYVGVMNNSKEGIDILINSFNAVKDIQPEMRLYLVGPWHYDTPGHLRLISKLKMETRIYWVGEFARKDIPGILSNAELLVLPRPDSRQARGGFPTKLGEYLATGVPVCVTKVGEIPDYLKDGESVFFAEPGSVDSFSKALKCALIDKFNAKRVGLNGKAVAYEFFDKSFQAKRLKFFFETVRQG